MVEGEPRSIDNGIDDAVKFDNSPAIGEKDALKGLESIRRDIERFSGDVVKSCNADIELRAKGKTPRYDISAAHSFMANIDFEAALVFAWAKGHVEGSKVWLKSLALRGHLDGATVAVNNLYRAMGHGDLIRTIDTKVGTSK